MQQEIDHQKSRWVKQYPAIWQRMIEEWSADLPEDRVWLMYAANYLLRTGGTRWAIDPFALKTRLPETPIVDLVSDLRQLSFVLLTHRHADHLDLQLIRALRNFPILWVIPEFLYSFVIEETGVPKARVIVPKMMEQIQINGVTITAFPGLHWDCGQSITEEALRGVPSVGYMAEFQQIRCLFPGDTRCYDPSQFPAFGKVNLVFAHLWLGRGCALMDQPPLLDAFCQFFLSLHPKRLAISHLHEVGREPEDYWTMRHYYLVLEQFLKLAPCLPVSDCFLGDSVEIAQ